MNSTNIKHVINILIYLNKLDTNEILIEKLPIPKEIMKEMKSKMIEMIRKFKVNGVVRKILHPAEHHFGGEAIRQVTIINKLRINV